MRTNFEENFGNNGKGNEISGLPEEEDKKAEIENRASFFARLEGMSEDDIETIRRAYNISKEAHRSQERASGERYFEHPRRVALILIDELGIRDPDMIVAALLHDTLEDSTRFVDIAQPFTKWKPEAIHRLTEGEKFSPEVAHMLVALTKPKADGMELKNKEEAFDLYINNLSKSQGKTLLVKMADRLHNLRTLSDTPFEKQKRKLKETKDVYIPLFKTVLAEYPAEGQKMLDKINLAIQNLETA